MKARSWLTLCICVGSCLITFTSSNILETTTTTTIRPGATIGSTNTIPSAKVKNITNIILPSNDDTRVISTIIASSTSPFLSPTAWSSPTSNNSLSPSSSSSSSSTLTTTTTTTMRVITKDVSQISLLIASASPTRDFSPVQKSVSFLPRNSSSLSSPVAVNINKEKSGMLGHANKPQLVKYLKYDRRRQRAAAPAEFTGASSPEHCERFIRGDQETRTFYSPGYPNNYYNNSDCVFVLEAPVGFLLRLDFRDQFHIEPSDECKFDYLEVRDGGHGFSTQLGQYCGNTFPPMVTSKERKLWLHFHSDESIEYSGFVAVYDFIPRPTSSMYDEGNCRIDVSGYEGFVNHTDVPLERMQSAIEHGSSLDCMWVITVNDGWKIQLSFLKFVLEKPNDCESNFVDVFTEKTDLPSRVKNFCGSIADSVTSTSNKLHIRFFAEASAINSTFSILFTAFREKVAGQSCDEKTEYDCEDATCISSAMRCNGRINCRFRWDEDECHAAVIQQSEHVVIIVVVFGLILGGMLAAFLVNCMKKIIRDHKIIREHIQQSRESKLDEVGRLSLKKSRENLSHLTITQIPPYPQFEKDSPTSVHILDDAAQRYYREVVSIPPSATMGGCGGNRNDVKKDSNSHSHNLHEMKDYADDRARINDAEMCDMACQTRESLFQPVFKNKVTQSPNQIPGGIRFSTFGYDSSGNGGGTPSPPPPPVSQKPHHHHHYHHIISTKNQLPKLKTTTIEMEDFGINTDMSPQQQQHLHQQQQQHDDDEYENKQNRKILLKKDDLSLSSRSFSSDIRKSAPDVIIMTSSH